jgi:hypothetical protein
MALDKIASYTGQNNTSTFNGKIQLDEIRGRFVVTDNDNNERTIVDIKGLTTIRSDGTYANRVGQASDDGRDGVWTVKPGVDLRDEGI